MRRCGSGIITIMRYSGDVVVNIVYEDGSEFEMLWYESAIP